MPTPPRLIRTVDDRLLDATIRHQIQLERFKEGLFRRLSRGLTKDALDAMVDDTRRRLRRVETFTRAEMRGARGKFIIQNLLKSQERFLSSGFRKAKAAALEEFVALGITEAEWATAALKSALPVTIDLGTASTGTLRTIVKNTPKHGLLISDWFDDMSRVAKTSIRRATHLGIANGLSTDEIVRSIEGTRRRGLRDGELQGVRNRLRAAVRTIATDVSAQTREEAFKKSRVVKKIRYVATLDSKTTDICAGLDNKVFNFDEGPRPPMHMNCRSTVVPVTLSFRELGIDLNEAPPGTRAQMPGSRGTATVNTSYGDWLRRQPVAVQEDVLGVERARMFRGGKVKIDKFVDYNRSPPHRFTIPELRRRAGLPPMVA